MKKNAGARWIQEAALNQLAAQLLDLGSRSPPE